MRRLLLVIVVAACGPGAAPQPAGPITNVKSSRVEPLIARLDEVAGSFHGLETDPVVVALLALGDEAVDPLIDAIERDDRTSQVLFDREKEWEKPTRAPVFRVAYWVVHRLIDTAYFEAANAEMRMARDATGRAEIAKELRVEWAKWRRLPRAERWYATLANDRANVEEWMDSAKKIFEWVPDQHRYDPFDVATKLPLQGEALRKHARPSVTELVAKRIDKVELRDACELARLVGRWDREAGKLHATREQKRAIATTGQTLDFGHCIWSLAVVRAELGDQAGLDDYAAWIATTTPPDDSHYGLVFQPMWMYPTRPSIVTASERLFGAAGSPWLPLVSDKPEPTTWSRVALLGHPMWRLPRFRAYVIAQLADHRVIGRVEVGSDRHWWLRLNNDINLSTTAEANAPSFPAQPGTIAVRTADYYAYTVTRTGEIPDFELYWDEPTRDRAIAALIAWLRAQP